MESQGILKNRTKRTLIQQQDPFNNNKPPIVEFHNATFSIDIKGPEKIIKAILLKESFPDITRK